VIKNIAGAAHVYGRKIVEMESFTSQGKHWRENPLDFKKLADYAFCNGMTRVVYHMSTHSPKEAGKPGWSYGAGTHYSPNLTWWSMSKSLNDYFSRISTLLQQGNFVADVAYYKGEEVPNFSIGYKYVRESLGVGYDYDDINTEILLQTTEVENGKIKLPCGMTYSVLVLPDNGKMSIEVLRVLENLLQKGATIIGKKPTKVYGLANYQARETELKALADKIWGKNVPAKQIKKYGNGYIVTGYTEKQMLEKQGIGADFMYQTSQPTSQMDYIHRSTATDEIYFVRNVDSIPLSTQMQFRVKGMQPQRWDPMTGEMTKLAVYKENKNGITLPMDFDAFGSTFVIFTKSDAESVHITSVSVGGNEIFPAQKKVENFPYTSNISNNSIQFAASKSADYQLKLSDGTSKNLTVSEQEIVKLNGPWDVRFEQGWGFEPIQKMDSLVDWVKQPNAALSCYSGMASYKLAFTLPKGYLSANKQYQLELGKVGEVARVYLNGVELGVSLFPPHKLLVDNVLREGQNNMVVEVANTWLNQYLYDIQQPLSEQRLRTNVDKADFVKNGAFPLPSGLIGPVQLVAISKMQIK
jgi:hypothetical protein